VSSVAHDTGVPQQQQWRWCGDWDAIYLISDGRSLSQKAFARGYHQR